jgi:hypothetical protein
MPLPGRSASSDGAAAECRHVGAAREFNDDRIVRAGARVVAFEGPAQAGRLHAHDRIDLRIEPGAALERLDRDDVALDAVAVAVQHRFDDEAEKRGELRRRTHDVAAAGAFKRGADLLRVRLIAGHAFMFHRAHGYLHSAVVEAAPALATSSRRRVPSAFASARERDTSPCPGDPIVAQSRIDDRSDLPP